MTQSRGILGIGVGILLLDRHLRDAIRRRLSSPCRWIHQLRGRCPQTVCQVPVHSTRIPWAYLSLIQSTSTETGVTAGDLLIDLTDDTPLADINRAERWRSTAVILDSVQ